MCLGLHGVNDGGCLHIFHICMIRSEDAYICFIFNLIMENVRIGLHRVNDGGCLHNMPISTQVHYK